MKTNKIFAGAMLCAVALMSGCSQEELVNEKMPSRDFSLTAYTGVGSRTTVTEGYSVNWTTDDEIFVYGTSGVYGALKLTEGANSANGKFSGTLFNDGKAEYAVYPKAGFTVTSGKPTAYTFPTSYTYPNSNSPMFGKMSDDEKSVHFGQHLCGMMRIKVTLPSEVTSGTMTLTGIGIAGEATFSETDGKATLTMSGTSSENSVKMTFTGSESDVYFLEFPIPAREDKYTGVTATLEVEGYEDEIFTATDFTATAGKIIVMPAIKVVTIDGSVAGFAKEVANLNEAQEALDNGSSGVTIENVSITEGATDADRTITIPAVTAEKEEEPITINIESISGATVENPLIIDVAEASTNEKVPTNVNITVPTTENGEKPVIKINMPEGHVNFNGTAEVIYATTSQTTFVVEEGAVIEKLVVLQGNVIVYGTVKLLERAAENKDTKTTVTIFGSGNVKVAEESEENVEIKTGSVWDGKAVQEPVLVDNMYTICTAEQLAWVADQVNTKTNSFAGKTIKLGVDIDLNNKDWEPIGQTGATQFLGVFDGQGHTIRNLYIDSEAETGKNYSSGLFGWIERQGKDENYTMAVKNLTVDGATIKGHHNVAVIAGYLIGIIENCHVTNAALTCTHANDDACGDKCGVISGIAAETNALIKNCTATNSTIKAGRDAGQIVGAFTTNPDNVVDCSATNVTVEATGDCTGANVNNALIGRK